MVILENYDLTELNTFGIKAKSKFFCEIKTEQDFLDLIKTEEFKNNKKLFVGGGSNILFTDSFFDGLIICNKLKGIERIKEDENFVWIKSMGGEWWHDLVLFTVDKNLWGIENLSLIYGTVGAAPVQNIGAYGTELKDVLEKVEVFDLETGEKKIFNKTECEFGYRDSIFKNKLKDKCFVVSIVLKLSKKENKNIKYKDLEKYFKDNNLEIKTSKDISNAIGEIRKNKLPDPEVLGNAGSFFKNVYVDRNKFNELKENYPDMPFFEEEKEKIKIPTGWLIDECGWKGKRIGNVGVYDKQALVLVNYGGATGKEIFDLSRQIIDSVYEKFGLKITPEVNFV